MDLSDFTFSPLADEDVLESFDCGDGDINDFLVNDSKNYQKEKITNTYLFKDRDVIAAFFSISNDCLNDLGFGNNAWNRFHRKTRLPNAKRIRQYPAVKITRLGVHLAYQGHGLSHQLLDFIKAWTFIEHKPACRLLLLDAYNQEKPLSVYMKNDFTFLLTNDKDDKSRIMYFDLMRLEQ